MNEPVKVPKADPLDIKLDIDDLMPPEAHAKYPPRSALLPTGGSPIPSGTSPRPAADDLDSLGRVQAEAVTKQFEAAAKSCESMGDEVKDRIARLQASLDECARDMRLISDAATAIREKGKQVRGLIESSSALSKQVRDACADLKKRVSVA